MTSHWKKVEPQKSLKVVHATLITSEYSGGLRMFEGRGEKVKRAPHVCVGTGGRKYVLSYIYSKERALEGHLRGYCLMFCLTSRDPRGHFYGVFLNMGAPGGQPPHNATHLSSLQEVATCSQVT